MKLPLAKPRRRVLPRRASLPPAGIVEALEERVLLSAVAATNSPLALLPNESTIASPRFSDLWWLQNTGQTLSSAPTGPLTGVAGDDIGATKAWDLTTGSNAAVVAVFDTGIDLTNPEFTNNLWKNPGEIPNNGIDDDHNGFVDDEYGWNFVDGNNNVQDTSLTNHGTLVSGVIGAQGNNGQGISGVAWNVDLLTVKVGTDTGVTSQDLIAGINYVIALKQRGVNIVAINASYISFALPTLDELNAIKSAGDVGISYVAAAGNSGLNFDSILPSGFVPSNMILVAATDNRDQLASFSDYGKNSVALGAPGVDILSTLRSGLFGVFSGTSFAAPMVSGAIALIKSYIPGATMDQVKNAILYDGDPDPSLAGKTITGNRLDVYRSLETMLGARAPIGHIDVLTGSTVQGWAFDYNGGRTPVLVAFLVDGRIVAAQNAATSLAPLQAAFGSADHGFAFTMPTLGPGAHSVQIYAYDISAFSGNLGPVIVANATVQGPAAPVGTAAYAVPLSISGWIADPDTPQTPITARMDVDGATVATTTANLARSDVPAVFGPAHGYAFTLPTLPPGIHRVDIYAVGTVAHVPWLVQSLTIDTNFAPLGSFDSFDGSTLSGWAFDPNAGSTPIRVRYTIDGGAPVYTTAGDTNPNLPAALGSTNHAFTITLPQLGAGPHTAAVWAIDSTNERLIYLGQRSANVLSATANALPFGAVNVATATRVTGWAFDPSTPYAPIEVRIDVDGVTGTPFLAAKRRDDLTPILHGPSFGFDQALALTPGAHRVDIQAIDAPGGNPVLIASRLVGAFPSFGFLLGMNDNMAQGWAYSPTTPGAATKVRLDVDGMAGPLITANAAYPGIGTIGYSIPLPHLSPGAHTITLSVIDPVTLVQTVIGARTITVS